MLDFLALSSLLLILSWRDCFCQVAADSSGGDIMRVDLLVAVLIARCSVLLCDGREYVVCFFGGVVFIGDSLTNGSVRYECRVRCVFVVTSIG